MLTASAESAATFGTDQVNPARTRSRAPLEIAVIGAQATRPPAAGPVRPDAESQADSIMRAPAAIMSASGADARVISRPGRIPARRQADMGCTFRPFNTAATWRGPCNELEQRDGDLIYFHSLRAETFLDMSGRNAGGRSSARLSSRLDCAIVSRRDRRISPGRFPSPVRA